MACLSRLTKPATSTLTVPYVEVRCRASSSARHLIALLCNRCRYELERGLLDGSVAVADLPRLWNEKMGSYLGCTPADDAEGVLQVPSLCCT